MGDILFLAHRIPWPADRGDKIRSFHILNHLTQYGRVHVGAFADDDRDMGFVPEIQEKFASVHIEKRDKPQWRAGIEAIITGAPVSMKSFASPSMQAWVDALIRSGKISHAFVFSGQMAQYVRDDFDGRFIMDFVDVDSAKFESYSGQGNPVMRWINAREGKMLSAAEHAIARKAHANLFVSEAEAALFRARSGLHANSIMPLGNGIDTVSYNPAHRFTRPAAAPHGPMIVFTGQMDYRPNIEAVCDFAENVLPIIRRQHPSAQFVIVGRNPTPAVTALSGKNGVHVTGAANVVVAPLRIARGIQNKVLEAMAMAKAVVASAAAAEGISANDGEHFCVAHSADEEAAMVSALLSDPIKAQRMGNAARAHVEKHYSWDGQLASLAPLMQSDDTLGKAA
jgi:polysaccharide biosynthesis protein PslH